MSRLNDLENKVLGMLLDGDNKVLEVLRQQAAHAKVSSRHMTGAGFFTEFYLPTDTPRTENDMSFKIGDVNGSAANVRNGLGFLLYIKHGILSMLEGYTYDEPWPARIDSLSLAYSGGENRDWDLLRKLIEPS
jgi:hypothetical protein